MLRSCTVKRAAVKDTDDISISPIFRVTNVDIITISGADIGKGDNDWKVIKVCGSDFEK